ncbi:ABC transporter permease [Streptomyces sp. NRRL F-5053]|uniref:ABC transporter permease n=1 Tax=Streptomyces sp. NRRL F-5053 TaxID=1463854 RepID=UPI0004CAE990|nr:ABC transporter permease [Streptomyces sp. NRRL F-5053]
MRASNVWKQPRAWLVVVVGCVLAALSTFSYLVPATDPEGHLHRLPLILVSEDEGVMAADGTKVDLGAQLVRGITRAAARDDRVEWTVVAERADAERALADQDAYAALDVPRDFTEKSLSLLTAGSSAERPALTVLTHRGVGGMAASMADKAVRKTAAKASTQLGSQLIARAKTAQKATADPTATTGRAADPTRVGAQPQSAAATPGFLALLHDPVQVTAQQQPLDAGSASSGGTIPLYLAVALLISGLLPASLLTMLVDARLGYLPLEIGPRRLLKPVVGIARSSTFLAKAVIGAVMGFAAGAVVTEVGLVSIDFGAQAPGRLVVFCGLACAAVTLLTLALFAVLGAPGQILALLVVTLIGIPLSGGAIPPEALPAGPDALGQLLPARHVVEGIRSLLFYGSDASQVTTAWLVLGAYALGSVLLGLLGSHFYDRRGYRRAHEHELTLRTAEHPAPEPLPCPSS